MLFQNCTMTFHRQWPRFLFWSRQVCRYLSSKKHILVQRQSFCSNSENYLTETYSESSRTMEHHRTCSTGFYIRLCLRSVQKECTLSFHSVLLQLRWADIFHDVYISKVKSLECMSWFWMTEKRNLLVIQLTAFWFSNYN